MRSYDEVTAVSPAVAAASYPDASIVGSVSPEDGHEYLEHPTGSGVWYIRNQATKQWEKWA